jgi:hypothetical protein
VPGTVALRVLVAAREGVPLPELAPGELDALAADPATAAAAALWIAAGLPARFTGRDAEWREFCTAAAQEESEVRLRAAGLASVRELLGGTSFLASRCLLALRGLPSPSPAAAAVAAELEAMLAENEPGRTVAELSAFAVPP